MPNITVYDLDDTLYPMQQYVWGGFEALDVWALDNLGLALFSDQAKAFYKKGARGDVFNRVLESASIPSDRDLIERMLAIYRGHAPDLGLYPDAKVVLDCCSDQDKCAIITDGCFLVQRRKVQSLGLEKRFPLIVYTDELGSSMAKPHPYAFEKVMDFFDCSGGDCTYIGDNPHKDFLAPKKLGWRTIRIRRPGAEFSNVEVEDQFSADQDIVSLEELIGLRRTCAG